MIGIGNYVLGDASGRQPGYSPDTWEPSGLPRTPGTMTGGASGPGGWITGIATSLFPGGVPALISAGRGGAGPAAAPSPSSGGGFDIGKIVPFALIGVAVIGGFFLIKKFRKKA